MNLVLSILSIITLFSQLIYPYKAEEEVVYFSGPDSLIISEILDGDLTGGLPKFVELTNTGCTTIDLSEYSIGNFNNGGTTLGGGASTVLSGMLRPGASYVISYENSDASGMGTFFDVYGFDPDNLDLAAVINGDDVVVLYKGTATGDGSDGTIVDIYGEIGVNGDNEVWDYTDSYAYRNRQVSCPNATFTASEWIFGGRSALDGEDAAGHVAATSPRDWLGPKFNEVRISAPGSADDTNNFVELIGSPARSMTGLYIIVLSGEFSPGTVDFAFDISAGSADEDGFFLLANTGHPDADPGDVLSSFDFFGSPSTFFLVEGWTGAVDDDLDTDDDGIFEATPWTSILDSLTFTDGDGTADINYSETILPADGNFTWAGAALVPDGGCAWQQLLFDDYSEDTPGATNVSIVMGGADTVAIYDIQGVGTESPIAGMTVTTSGIVTGDFQGEDSLLGFFIQDPEGDANASTSDGIFIYLPIANPLSSINVEVGDSVTLVGNVKEFNTFTEMDFITEITIHSGGHMLAPTLISLPEAQDGDLERYEGMLVQFDHALVIAQNFFLGQYGQMTLAGPDDEGSLQRPKKPTNLFDPGSIEAMDLQDENFRRFIVLDDGQDVDSQGDNPNPVPYIGAPPPAVIRGGDTICHLIGVIDYGRINSGGDRDFRIHPVAAPTFKPGNPRQPTPSDIGGDLKVASFNVLNYFTTLGSRGAQTASEFKRQTDKIVHALSVIDADIVGLIEIENNGYGSSSAIQSLTDSLNKFLGDNMYDFVDPGVSQIGTDEIAVGFIYKTGTVSTQGAASILDDTFDANFRDDFNRPALAQTFRQLASNELLTIAVNHLKSKGSSCDGVGDPEDPNGQGNCNGVRTDAAKVLAHWMKSDPTGSGDPDFLIIGDLNAYAMEDPVRAILDSGFINIVQYFDKSSSYSFTFDGEVGCLDHALANSDLACQVTGATKWHINTDEPRVLDYNESFNPAGYFSEDPFRSSDHDPTIIGLDLNANLNLMTDIDGVDSFCLDDQKMYSTSEKPAAVQLKWIYTGTGQIKGDSTLENVVIDFAGDLMGGNLILSLTAPCDTLLDTLLIIPANSSYCMMPICQGDIIEISDMTTLNNPDTIRAASHISISKSLIPSSTLSLYAGEEVEMVPTFQVEASVILNVDIVPCRTLESASE